MNKKPMKNIDTDEYYSACPDPYTESYPLLLERPRNYRFDEDGYICARNLSAFWLPEFTLQKKVAGTIYTITGSYDGTETLDSKMERVMAKKFTEKVEDFK